MHGILIRAILMVEYGYYIVFTTLSLNCMFHDSPRRTHSSVGLCCGCKDRPVLVDIYRSCNFVFCSLFFIRSVFVSSWIR